jgi:hypothetical protein
VLFASAVRRFGADRHADAAVVRVYRVDATAQRDRQLFGESLEVLLAFVEATVASARGREDRGVSVSAWPRVGWVLLLADVRQPTPCRAERARGGCARPARWALYPNVPK